MHQLTVVLADHFPAEKGNWWEFDYIFEYVSFIGVTKDTGETIRPKQPLITHVSRQETTQCGPYGESKVDRNPDE